MKSNKKLSADSRLYWIAGPDDVRGDLVDCVRTAAEAGLRIFQLRDKKRSDKELISVAENLKTALEDTECCFIINDRVDLAIKVDADGVHVGQDDVPAEQVRTQVGKDKIVGLSTHSVSQAQEAMKLPVDYIGFGPIYSTPTKPDYAPIGYQDIRLVASFARIPFFCIGGIDCRNIRQLVSSGAGRAAVVRAIAGSENISNSVRDLNLILKEVD